MLRIPQFSMDAELKSNWEQLKKSIQHSSPGFYHFIEAVTAAQLDALPFPIAFTVWKYFNRAKYRATPYGSFAGISIVNLQHRNTNEPLQISNDQLIHKFANWSKIANTHTNLKTLLLQDQFLFANSSYYQVKDAIRYISFDQQQHQLSAVMSGALMLEILRQCAAPKRSSSV